MLAKLRRVLREIAHAHLCPRGTPINIHGLEPARREFEWRVSLRGPGFIVGWGGEGRNGLDAGETWAHHAQQHLSCG